MKYRVHFFDENGKNRLTCNYATYDFAMSRIDAWKTRKCFSFAVMFEVDENEKATEIGCFEK